MTRRTTSPPRRATSWIALIACLVFSTPVAGQSDERKPPPAAKDQARKDDKTGPPRTAKPEVREKKRSDERIRLDAPVSFPVDI